MIRMERPDTHSRAGPSIRAERERQGLTVRELARLAGMTPSALSQIERGLVDPSISSLRRIAESLGVPMFWFLMDERTGEPGIVVRKADRRILKPPPWTAEYQLMTPGFKRNLEMMSYTLQPGEDNLPEPASHQGDECIVVLHGEAEVEVAGVKYRLGQGDSIYVSSGSPHRVVNTGTVQLDAIVAVSEPIV